MSYPPYPPPDPNRPQDTPRDQSGQQPPGGFPTYGRPPEPPPPPFVPPTSPMQGSPYQPYPGPQYPPQYGYGYGYQGIQQVKTNGLAVAALVCGLVSVFLWIVAPVAVALGIGALVQIKRRRESGTAQAVIGLSFGSLFSVIGAGMLILMFALDWNEGTDSDYGSPAPVASYTPDKIYVDELAVGECFDDGDEESEVLRQPCPVLHDGELISNVTLPPGTYPGDAKAKQAAQTACRQEFTKYVGVSPDKSVRKSSFWYPDEDLWDDGDRVVICAAYGTNGDQLTGSIKGTKR